MGSSRPKNFRQRRSGSEDLNGDEKRSASSPSADQPKPRGPKVPEGIKLLSFAENEEDDDGVAPIRSSISSSRAGGIHKLSSAKDRSAPLQPIPSNVRPQTGQYTKEKIRELQKNARSSKSPATSLPTNLQNSEASAEPVIVLEGLVKLAPPPHLSGLKEENDEREDEEQDEDNGVGDQMRFAGLSSDTEAKDSSSGILDQAAIDAIRAKRQRLRQSHGLLPDYVSLDGGGGRVVGSRSPDGRFGDGEESDFHGRVSLFADKMYGGTKKGVFEDVDERMVMVVSEQRVADGGYRGTVNEVDVDEDEEDRRWEEEQFRKGLGKMFDEAAGHLVSASVLPAPAMHPQPSHILAGASLGLPSSIDIGISRSAEVIPIWQKTQVARPSFYEISSKLKETHNRTLNCLMRTDENLSEALSFISLLENRREVYFHAAAL